MPPEKQFSKPPSGTEVNGDAIKKMVQGAEGEEHKEAPPIEQVAEALGGTVTGEADEPEAEEVEVKMMDPIVDGEVVDKEDQKEYLRTLLAGEPFGKTYEMYGGNVIVRFKTRTTGENDQVDIDLRGSGAATLIKAKSFAIVRERMRMVTSCEKLVVGTTSAEVSTNYFSEMNEPAFAAIRKSFRNFEGICDVMFERANDANFWKGIAGTT